MSETKAAAGTEVTARDVKTNESNTVTITNDYVLVTDGEVYRHDVQVHRRKDGGWTHVITVKCDASGRAS